MATKPFVDPNAPKGGRQVQIFGPNGEVQNAQFFRRVGEEESELDRLLSQGFSRTKPGDSPVQNNQYCGNVIYEHGNIIITPISSSNDYASSVADLAIVGKSVLEGQDGYNGTNDLENLTVGFSSSVTLNEYQYKCVIRDNEFGYSLNPSLLSGSQSTAPLLGTNYVYKDFATGSYFSPYITTVGLYDNNQNLLAIGKLSVPTKVPMDSDLEIQVSFDSL